MTQVFVIHGGTSAFPTHKEFLGYLENKELEFERLEFRGWKEHLQDNLGVDYKVVQPRMPNRESARYDEWKIWFEKFVPFMQDGLALVGHSLGGLFLAKYLSEETLPKKVTATFLLAAPFDSGGRDRQKRIIAAGFSLPKSIEKFSEQAGKIFLYHNKDDAIVNFEELKKYQGALPKAEVRVFEDRNHFFSQKEFPELVADIKSLNG
jgi:predicted alpha/beta hydrolase family esterase